MESTSPVAPQRLVASPGSMADLAPIVEHVGAVKAATDDGSPDGQPVQPRDKKANKRTTANTKVRRAYHTKDNQGCKTCR